MQFTVLALVDTLLLSWLKTILPMSDAETINCQLNQIVAFYTF
jgi:hypothetical protein